MFKTRVNSWKTAGIFLVFEMQSTSLWHHRDPVKCEVAPIKHAPEECNGRSKDYMKFRGKLGRKDETEVCN